MSYVSTSPKDQDFTANSPTVALPATAATSPRLRSTQPRGAQSEEAFQTTKTWQRWFRSRLLKRLNSTIVGSIQINDMDGCHYVQSNRIRTGNSSRAAIINVHDPKAYALTALEGGLGAAESYARGYWSTPSLDIVMGELAHGDSSLGAIELGLSRFKRPINYWLNTLRRNTKKGSARNIAAHYDLSNEFFAQFLDPTMTYSSGIFLDKEDSLEQSSFSKYERICRQLDLTPNDHVLEIGCGWGGFAVHAAKRFGCRVTATTISKRQYEFVAERIEREQLADRICLKLEDYRDLNGTFDKLVSIEMIEAVGEEYLETYFQTCHDRLKKGGLMMLQAITIPDDRYKAYRKSVDFIRRYIFPGGFLPSLGRMAECAGQAGNLRLVEANDFSLHYAETLRRWRTNFLNNIEQIRELGFDRRFERLWEYYLCYCEAGFQQRQIGVGHFLFAKREATSRTVGIPFMQ